MRTASRGSSAPRSRPSRDRHRARAGGTQDAVTSPLNSRTSPCHQRHRATAHAVDTSCPPTSSARAPKPVPRPHSVPALAPRREATPGHGRRHRRPSLPCQATSVAHAAAVASPTWSIISSPLRATSLCSGIAPTGGRSTSHAIPARPRAPKAASATHDHNRGAELEEKQTSSRPCG